MDWNNLYYDAGRNSWITQQQASWPSVSVPPPAVVADASLTLSSPDVTQALTITVKNVPTGGSVSTPAIFDIAMVSKNGEVVYNSQKPFKVDMSGNAYTVSGAFSLIDSYPTIISILEDYPYIDVDMTLKDTTNFKFITSPVRVRIYNELPNVKKTYES